MITYWLDLIFNDHEEVGTDAADASATTVARPELSSVNV